MQTLELIILAFTYTSLIIAIFLEVLCYVRKMENIETIAFTVSLLLLVISISLSPLLQEKDTTTVFTLTCMAIVSTTTFFNTLSERVHSMPLIYRNIHGIIALLLIASIFIGNSLGFLMVVQNAIVVFLIGSVVASMILLRTTKPRKRFAHQEKSNRFFALVFLTIVPIYLVVHFVFAEEYSNLQFGFLLYLAFTVMAASKIYDDLQRLSLIKMGLEPQKQHFKNYGLTDREEEIATLLSKGLTYQTISEQLFISLPTVKTHASNIYKKCGVKTRHELTVLLIQ